MKQVRNFICKHHQIEYIIRLRKSPIDRLITQKKNTRDDDPATRPVHSCLELVDHLGSYLSYVRFASRQSPHVAAPLEPG